MEIMHVYLKKPKNFKLSYYFNYFLCIKNLSYPIYLFYFNLFLAPNLFFFEDFNGKNNNLIQEGENNILYGNHNDPNKSKKIYQLRKLIFKN
jgi:hypothetical protein